LELLLPQPINGELLMEIEFDSLNLNAKAMIWIVLIPVLILFGFVGENYTVLSDEGRPRVLSWNEWRIYQLERAYHDELNDLRAEVDLLVGMLNSSPDPVRAQITAERIANQYDEGQDALASQREYLINAAFAVSDWASGLIDLTAAQNAVQTAGKLLSPAAGAEK